MLKASFQSYSKCMPSTAGDENNFILGGTGQAACVATCLGIVLHSGNLSINFSNDLCLIFWKRKQAQISYASHLYYRCISMRSLFSFFNQYLLFQRYPCCVLMPYFHVRLQVHDTGMFFLTFTVIVKTPTSQLKHVNHYLSEQGQEVLF